MSSLYHKILCSVLCFLMTFSPALVHAQGIIVDTGAKAKHQAQLDAARNGVPIVNIPAPNRHGISHSKYTEFNVSNRGVIINNSNAIGRSQLGGVIGANPLLHSGSAAKIVNEVTGTNRSLLNGYIEVFGKRADYILANPNGITVNGGGFINIPKAMLTTGVPRWDEHENLLGLDVDKGDIEISGAGLNARNIDAFSMVTRVAKINAGIYAKDLTVTTGTGQYDYLSGRMASSEASGSKPAVSIDSTALGGMYADRIRLVGTEKGVGVNLEGLTQSTDHLEISSAGKIQLRNNIVAQNELIASGDSIVISGAVNSSGAIKLDANNAITIERKTDNSDPLVAGNNIAFSASDVAVNGGVSAGSELGVTARNHIEISDKLSSEDKLTLKGKSIRVDSSVTAGKVLRIEGQEGVHSTGDIASGGSMTVTAGVATLEGDITANGSIEIESTGKLATSGTMSSLAQTTLQGQDIEVAGDITTGSDLTISASQVAVISNAISSQGNIALSADNLKVLQSAIAGGDFRAVVGHGLITSGVLSAGQELAFQAGSMDIAEKVLSTDAMHLRADDSITTRALLSSGKDFVLNAGQLQLHEGITSGGDLSLDVGGNWTSSNDISSIGSVYLKASGIDLSGHVIAGNNLSIAGTGDVSAKGQFSAGNLLRVSGNNVAASGLLVSNDRVEVAANDKIELTAETGRISAVIDAPTIELDASKISNSATVSAGTDLNLHATDSVTNTGVLASAGNIHASIKGQFTNDKGAVISKGDITLEGEAAGESMASFTNASGQIESYGGSITISADEFINYNSEYSVVAGRESVFRGAYCSTGNTRDNCEDFFTSLTGDPFSYSRRRTWAVDNAMLRALGLNTAERTFSRSEVQAAINKSREELLVKPDPTRESYVNSAQGHLNSGHEYAVRSPRYSVLVKAVTVEDSAENIDKMATITAKDDLYISSTNFRNTGSALTSILGDITVDTTNFVNEENAAYSHSSVIWGIGKYNEHRSPRYENHGSGVEKKDIKIAGSGGTIVAGGDVVITATHATNGIESYTTGGQGTYPESTMASVLSPLAGETPVAPVDDSHFSKVEVPLLPEHLSQLYIINKTPGHRYRVETNPVLLSMSEFLGSDYFFKRAGFTMDETEQVLGDAGYETKLVQEQIYKLTGGRFLDSGVTSDADQMQILMDNALAEKDSLSLSVGVALTEDQIASLHNDILWMEKKTVAGEEVFVPVVYLASNSLDKLATDGAVIVGKSVKVVADDVKNSGAIVAKEDVTITTEEFLNSGGTVSGATSVAVTATGDITNRSGVIEGGNVSLTAEGDIVSDKYVKTHNAGGSVVQTSGARGAIRATGDLQLTAGNDVVLSGTDVVSGGNTSISAVRDVAIVGKETTASSHIDRGKKNRSWSKDSHFDESVVAAGENIEISAGRDVAMQASLAASGADTSITAGEHVNITSAAEHNEFYYYSKSKGSGVFGKKKVSSGHELNIRNKGSKISGGGNVKILAGSAGEGDLAVIGSDINADGNLALESSGKISVASAQDVHESSRYHSSKGFLGAKLKSGDYTSSTQVASNLSSGGTFSATAEDDVRLSASNIFSDGELSLTSNQGDINIVAAQNEYTSRNKKEKSGFSLGFDSGWLTYAESSVGKGSAKHSTSVGSSVISNENITIAAHNDAVVIGSELMANEDLKITAGRDVNILSGRSEEESTQSTKKSVAGFGFNFSEDEISLSSGIKITEQKEEFSGLYNAQSNLAANKNVTISSGRNVTQISSNIASGENVTISAGEDISIEAAHDVEKIDSYVRDIEVGAKLAAKQSVTRVARTLADLPNALQAGKGNAAAEAVTAASAAMEAYSALSSAMTNTASISATAGATYSEAKQENTSKVAIASSINSGNNISLTANDDLSITGAQIHAANDVSLTAGDDVFVSSTENTYTSSFSTSFADARGGIGASVGAGGASIGVTGSAAVSLSEGKGKVVTPVNTGVTAGQSLSVTSEKDTTIQGANLKGSTVDMNVGENLTVRSVQGKTSSKGSQLSVGGSVTVGYGVSVSVNAGVGSNSSKSKWVDTQTSIVGEKKVDIYTGKNTHVEGAVIAAENDNLTLNTETLTFADIKDSDKGKGFNANVSASTSFTPKAADANEASTNPQDPNNIIDTATISGGYSSHDKRQINRATIGAGTIIIRSDPNASLDGLNRNLAKAQELTKNSETVVKVYIDSATIADIASGGKELTNKIKNLHTKITDCIADLKGKETLTPQELEDFKEKVSKDAAEILAVNKGVNSEEARKSLSDAVGEEYTKLRDEGKSNSEALGIIGSQLSRLSDVADIVAKDGFVLTYTDGKPYLENIKNLLAVVGVDDAVLLAGVTLFTAGTLKVISEKYPEVADELSRGLDDACNLAVTMGEAGAVALISTFVKLSPIFAAQKGLAVLETDSGDEKLFYVGNARRDPVTGKLEYIEDRGTGEYYRVGQNEDGTSVVSTGARYIETANGMEPVPGYSGNDVPSLPSEHDNTPPSVDTGTDGYSAEGGVDTGPLVTPDNGSSSPIVHTTPDQSGEIDVTAPMLAKFTKGSNDRPYGQELPVTYDPQKEIWTTPAGL
ncbi:hemagglutinin repeat-containing protein, partial [Halodesulfovibrio aestuarii]